MLTEELRDYIETHCNAIKIFGTSALELELDKDSRRASGKKFSAEHIQKDTDLMTATFVTSIYNKLRLEVEKKHHKSYDEWVAFIEGNGVLDDLEESVDEMEFE